MAVVAFNYLGFQLGINETGVLGSNLLCDLQQMPSYLSGFGTLQLQDGGEGVISGGGALFSPPAPSPLEGKL